MEFFKIRRDIPFMRHALTFNVISAITFVLAALLTIPGMPSTVVDSSGWLLSRSTRRRISSLPMTVGVTLS